MASGYFTFTSTLLLALHFIDTARLCRTANMPLINEIFVSVRMGLVDDWMSLERDDKPAYLAHLAEVKVTFSFSRLRMPNLSL